MSVEAGYYESVFRKMADRQERINLQKRVLETMTNEWEAASKIALRVGMDAGNLGILLSKIGSAVESKMTSRTRRFWRLKSREVGPGREV